MAIASHSSSRARCCENRRGLITESRHLSSCIFCAAIFGLCIFPATMRVWSAGGSSVEGLFPNCAMDYSTDLSCSLTSTIRDSIAAIMNYRQRSIMTAGYFSSGFLLVNFSVTGAFVMESVLRKGQRAKIGGQAAVGVMAAFVFIVYGVYCCNGPASLLGLSHCSILIREHVLRVVNYCFIAVSDCYFDLILCNAVMEAGGIKRVKITRETAAVCSGLSRSAAARRAVGRIRVRDVMRSRRSIAAVFVFIFCHGFKNGGMNGRYTVCYFWCICTVICALHRGAIISRCLSRAGEETLFALGKVGSNSAYLIFCRSVFYIWCPNAIWGNLFCGCPISVLVFVFIFSSPIRVIPSRKNSTPSKLVGNASSRKRSAASG